jgi:DNA polymerase I-like protein with 3'-5' exonuclease and polymerase domains
MLLERAFAFDIQTEAFAKREPYGLGIKQCRTWGDSKTRVLVVMQTVDIRDLKEGEMLGHQDTMTPVKNAIKYARKLSVPYQKKGLPEAAYTVANFNAFRHLHLSPGHRREAEGLFAERIHKLIQKIKPTHILVSGDQAMRALFPMIEHPQYKRGWVHELKVQGLDLKVVSTLDFFKLMEKDGEYANLLGFWCRHLMNLFIGRMPHNLSHIQAKPKYVDTIEKFNQVMRRFDEARIIAVDTETRNLSVLFNRIYTIQFCMDHAPETGYVIPVDHPLVHWTDDERLYIKRELKKRFSKDYEDRKLLITMNGMFDLRVIRQCLKIPIIWHDVWEVTFGEHELDENISALNHVTSIRDEAANDSSKFGGLRPIYCSYGNDFYFKAAFSKEERSNTGSTDPSSKDFLAYAATDVVSIFHIRKEQIRRSSFMEIAGQNYKPYYLRHMLCQMGDTAHQLSHLKQDGSLIQKSYLKHLLGAESPLQKELTRAEGEFKVHREVKQANKELLNESGFKSAGLGFKNVAATWMFKLTKPLHKRKLFLDILGLEPLSQTATGAPAIDKAFVAHYKDTNKIISLYGEFQALHKLMSTYVKGWYKRLTVNIDAAFDNHLRPDYSIWAVVTGRLASMGPNLQQIPSRGKLAKIIKRMFVAKKGYLMIRYDYSAHEVRVWSIIAGDKVLAEAFRAGQKLRQDFIKNPTDENKKAIKEKGDIHILNVLRFFGQLVDKDHPLRDAVKAVVFGVLYGKGAKTLGIDTKKGDMDSLKGKISALYEESLVTKDSKRLIEINKMLEELDLKLTALLEEDRTGYAQDIIDKMFKEFKAGARWTKKMQEMAENEYYVYAPNGRRRFLPAAMTENRAIVAEQVRRGSNAPVQGMASEIGVKAGREIMKAYYMHLRRFKEWLSLDGTNWDWRVLFNRTVHDANYYSVPYEMVIPFIHILQYQATYGVTQAYLEDFNIEFTVEPEIEIEIGAHDAQTYKWDWSLPNLISGLKSTLKDSEELGVLEGSQSEVLEKILKPWTMKDTRRWLQKNFPLLNVPDLDAQIRDAIKEEVEA